jgi:hypothetical protein
MRGTPPPGAANCGRRPPIARLVACLIPIGLLALAGCGGGKGTVSGEVTFKGQPIPWGRITFLGQEGEKVGRSSPIVSGKYTIKDYPAGPVKISVESYDAKKVDTSKIPPMMLERSKEGGWKEPPPEVVGKHLPIPAKYADPEQSGLNYTVPRGTSTHDIALTP